MFLFSSYITYKTLIFSILFNFCFTLIFFDFSDDSWHIGLEGAIKIANAYPKAQLLLSHWGTVDAPDMKPFNADPKMLEERIYNPEAVHV